jgi:hypothetical protein
MGINKCIHLKRGGGIIGEGALFQDRLIGRIQVTSEKYNIAMIK